MDFFELVYSWTLLDMDLSSSNGEARYTLHDYNKCTFLGPQIHRYVVTKSLSKTHALYMDFNSVTWIPGTTEYRCTYSSTVRETKTCGNVVKSGNGALKQVHVRQAPTKTHPGDEQQGNSRPEET